MWRVRGREVAFGATPRLVGIVNVTPDSFSDGGRFFDASAAVDRGFRLIEQGASVVDVGGESTRPGADPVGVEEELDRVLPVIEALVAGTEVPISIDTTKAEVAASALEAGAAIVNDVSGFVFEPALAGVAAKYGAGVIVMHMRGEPRTMQRDPRYEDLFGEIAGHLASAAGRALEAGVEAGGIVVDPGIGFGKTAADNYRLLTNLDPLLALGYPVLIGHSRKTFLDPEGEVAPRDRLPETIAAAVVAAMAGAHLLRVHDVAAHARALEVYRRAMEARS